MNLPEYCLQTYNFVLLIVGCLDTLTIAKQQNLVVHEEAKEKTSSTKVYTKDDFSVVNRFESKFSTFSWIQNDEQIHNSMSNDFSCGLWFDFDPTSGLIGSPSFLYVPAQHHCNPITKISYLSQLMRFWHFPSSVNILQTHMCSHPVSLDVWLLVGLFVYFHTSCRCAGSPEPLLVAYYVISTIISWAG